MRHSTRGLLWTGRRGEAGSGVKRWRPDCRLRRHHLWQLTAGCTDKAAQVAASCCVFQPAPTQLSCVDKLVWWSCIKLALTICHHRRVTAMVRLEGLVKGGAAGSFEGCFMEHLRMLKDPLLDQMVDRWEGEADRLTKLTALWAACCTPRHLERRYIQNGVTSRRFAPVACPVHGQARLVFGTHCWFTDTLWLLCCDVLCCAAGAQLWPASVLTFSLCWQLPWA